MIKPSRRDFLKASALGLSHAVLAAYGVSSWRAQATSQVVVETLNHPDFLGSELLTRPTDRSITVTIIPSTSMEAYFEYGTAPGEYTAQTPIVSADRGTPIQAVMENLTANTRWYYRVCWRTDDSAFEVGQERSFMTQRGRGETFIFGIQADSHLGTAHHNDPALYSRTLQSAAQDNPDFYIDLGDTFRATKLQEASRDTITQLYLNQRPFFGQIAHSAPLFLVNGNHEQEWGWLLDGTSESIPVLCAQARKMYYPQPAPNDFYTGDAEPKPHIALAEDYYAWEWGEALFVVIDPYWNTVSDPGGVGKDKVSGQDDNRSPWNWTLGDIQYRWLKATLENSTAPYKFVFQHHLLGTCRGGIEWAAYYEWGGKERNGSDTFAEHRPGWELPIHQLMVQNHVSVFFQGHDHVFVRQELDGIVYQTVPMCADPGYNTYNRDDFTSGDTLPNTGHLRVTVSPEKATIDYIRSYLDQPDELAFTYAVMPMLQQANTALPTYSMILGRPTDHSISATLLSDTAHQLGLEYGTESGSYSHQIEPFSVQAGEPQLIAVHDLTPNTRYFYRLIADGIPSDEHTFHTQRDPGSTFTFTMDADPHNRDPQFNRELYRTTLTNILLDHPDFHINLGDTFMTEKVRPKSYAEAQNTFTEMYPYFGIIGMDVPLFLVNGNHEGELGWLLTQRRDQELPRWSTQLRQYYYPNPLPGDFYVGASDLDPDLQTVRDGYFSWMWGNALLIVLDPFWYTREKPSPDDLNTNWNWTLGKAQYDWLRTTLETSSATSKFVFIHHLVGGGRDARGGIEVASLFEWGGNNIDGTYGFDVHRPGWGTPIHHLLVENHVSAVFHGHDHVYVKQNLDGIIYQEVPQPSHPVYDNVRLAADYGYQSGVVLGSSGHLRVTVTPTQTIVEYVRAYRQQDENENRENGYVSDMYVITQ